MSLQRYPVTYVQEDVQPSADNGKTAQPSDTSVENQAPSEIISQPPNDGAPQGGSQAQPQGMSFIWILAIFFLFMWVLIIMPQRREKKKHAAMQASLKKGDRVQSIGGIRGTIAELRDTEIVVKVDESNNTQMTFARSAIQGVVDGDKKVS